MKKIILLIIMAGCCTGSPQAQSNAADPGQHSTYFTAMQTNVERLDTATVDQTFRSLANRFGQIGNAAKKEWLPWYYASFCYAVMAYHSPDISRIDGLADSANACLLRATTIGTDNSEISCLRAMILYCRVLADPVNRWATQGNQAADYLAKAKKQDPDNPRCYLIEAQTKLHMPESWGGGMQGAAPVIRQTLEKFNAFVPVNTITPHWGKPLAEKMLNRLTSTQ